MLIYQLCINLIIFNIAIRGIFFNYTQVIVVLMGIELLLLSVNLNIIISTVFFKTIFGQIFSIFILTVAAAEASVGLALIIIYYRLTNNIYIYKKSSLKG